MLYFLNTILFHLLRNIMLNLQINDPELERNLIQTYGDNKQSIIEAFTQFIKNQNIKNDVTISKKQAINGEFIELDTVFDSICDKYK
jgi:hypothetical protein